MSSKPELQTLPPSSGKVLVVEDSDTNRFLLKAILNANGHQVDDCRNGRECLEYCNEHLPLMIVMDVMMPELDGIEATRELRKKYTKDQLPVVMVTTRCQGKDIAEGLQAGANDYVTKPVDRAILVARIGNQLALAQSHLKIEEQRQQIDRALRIQNAIGDVLPLAVVVHGNEGEIVYANQHLKSQVEVQACTHIHDLVSAIYNGKLASELMPWFEQFAGSEEVVAEKEIEFQSEKLRSVRVITKPVSVDGTLSLRLWSFEDLTHMRELERWNQQRMRLDTVALFSQGVAHNFNNIMGGILGASEVLRRLAAQNPKADHCLSLIRKGVENGSRLTRKMAGLAHYDHGSSFVTAPEIREAIANIILVHQELAERNIEIKVNIPQDLPNCRIHLNGFLEIMANVVNNAVESCENGGIVEINLLPEVEAQLLKIVVVDNGCGISSSVLGRLFEPFFSTKNMDTVNGVSVSGNGLGLWKVYSILKACGGDVKIDSVEGKGTTVLMTLVTADEHQGCVQQKSGLDC